jgi:hypothetical protein
MWSLWILEREEMSRVMSGLKSYFVICFGVLQIAGDREFLKGIFWIINCLRESAI